MVIDRIARDIYLMHGSYDGKMEKRKIKKIKRIHTNCFVKGTQKKNQSKFR